MNLLPPLPAPHDIVHRSDMSDRLLAALPATELTSLAYWSYPQDSRATGHIAAFTHDRDWAYAYISKGMYRFDPRIKAIEANRPLDWREVCETPEETAFMSSLTSVTGTTHGLSMPVPAPLGARALIGASFTGTAEAWDRLYAILSPTLTKLAGDLVSIAEAATSEQPPLTPRELGVLQWAAEGKTTRDTSAILQIHQRTVEMHLKSAREKLDALNTTHAVARALAHGFILPPSL